MMLRTASVAVIAVAAFVAAFWVTRSFRAHPKQDADVASLSPVAVKNTNAPAGDVGVRSAKKLAPAGLPAIPVVKVTRRAPTPYEALVLERPELFYPMKQALQRALVADKHLTRPCFEGTDLVGETSVQFSWLVESTPEGAKASGLQYVQVADGVALPEAVIACVERTLGGSYEALPDQFEFTDFHGSIPMRLSWKLGEGP